MTNGELIYLFGVLVAFCAFAVTLAIVTHNQHLPPVGGDAAQKPKVVPVKH